MSDTPPTKDETPDLPFEENRKAEASTTPPPVSGGTMEDIVTRLDDDRPPRWAMNWRPIGEEDSEEAGRDHHPARIAGQREIAEQQEISTQPEEEPPAELEPSPVPATPTSRTWSASAGRHPQAPRVDATGRVVTDQASPAPSGRDAARSSLARVLSGWFVALGIGLAWLSTAVGTESEPSAQTPSTEPQETRDMLARPVSPMETAPSPLLLEEIATLQEERAAMLAELDAAAALMADHQRLSHELDRTARRWRTATEQLQFLDESLEAAIVERARLAAELAIVHRMLDEARDSD